MYARVGGGGGGQDPSGSKVFAIPEVLGILQISHLVFAGGNVQA